MRIKRDYNIPILKNLKIHLNLRAIQALTKNNKKLNKRGNPKKKIPLNIGVRNLSKPTSQAKNIKTIKIGWNINISRKSQYGKQASLKMIQKICLTSKKIEIDAFWKRKSHWLKILSKNIRLLTLILSEITPITKVYRNTIGLSIILKIQHFIPLNSIFHYKRKVNNLRISLKETINCYQ